MDPFLGATLAALLPVVTVALSARSSDDPFAVDRDAGAAVDSGTTPDGQAASDAGKDGGEEGCAGYALAHCSRLAACADGFFFPERFLDSADCAATYEKTCRLEHAAPGAAIPADALGQCTKDTAALSCPEVLGRRRAASCGRTGGLAEASPCGTDTQCQSGFCAKSSEACGTCRPAPAAGAPCLVGRCAVGATCDGDLDNPRCVAVVDQGSACGPSAYCRFGLACVSGKCSPGLAEGAPCLSGPGPDDPICDGLKGLQSNGFTSTSVCVKPAYVQLGESCGFNGEDTDAGLVLHPAICRATGSCPLYVPGDLTCLPRGAEGEACGESQLAPCRSELSCREGRCVFDDPAACR